MSELEERDLERVKAACQTLIEHFECRVCNGQGLAPCVKDEWDIQEPNSRRKCEYCDGKGSYLQFTPMKPTFPKGSQPKPPRRAITRFLLWLAGRTA